MLEIVEDRYEGFAAGDQPDGKRYRTEIEVRPWSRDGSVPAPLQCTLLRTHLPTLSDVTKPVDRWPKAALIARMAPAATTLNSLEDKQGITAPAT
jgi:hypothetical protein